MTLSFDVETSRDMLNKLERERKRIDEAGGDRERLSDHGINFAVTAWHLTDWVWRDMKRKHELKAKIAKARGVPPQKLERDDFQAYVGDKCLEMLYCQGICMASKHVSVDRNFPEKTIASNISLTEFISTGLGTEWVLKIIDEKGNRRRAVPIFDAVLEFWKDFISDNKVADPHRQEG